MGVCVHCGKPAGLFRSRHDDCERRNRIAAITIERKKQDGVRAIKAAIGDAVRSASIPSDLSETISEIRTNHGISDQDVKPIFVSIWENTAEAFLDDSIITTDEERVLHDLQKATGIDLGFSPIFSRVVQAAALREVMEGRIPTQFRIDIPLPFNLQKGERPVWYYKNSDYVEDKVRRHYEGRSQGISVRVAKGVYYRVGAFKGRPVDTTERVRVDSGLFLVTDKHLYFAGPKKSLRIPYAKIVSFEPFENGIGIHRDAVTATAQMFTVADGWFVYNLVTNIAAW